MEIPNCDVAYSRTQEYSETCTCSACWVYRNKVVPLRALARELAGALKSCFPGYGLDASNARHAALARAREAGLLP